MTVPKVDEISLSVNEKNFGITVSVSILFLYR